MKRWVAVLLMMATDASWAEPKAGEATAFATLKMAQSTPADQVAIRELLLKLESGPLLDEIAVRLALRSAWSMTERQVNERLVELLDATVPEGSAIGKVQAKGTSPAAAAALANTAASVLRDHLEARTESRFNRLQADIRRQEEKLLEKRTVLSRVIKNLGAISKHPGPGVVERHPEKTGLADPSFVSARVDFDEAQKWLELLRKEHSELLANPFPKVGEVAWAKAP